VRQIHKIYVKEAVFGTLGNYVISCEESVFRPKNECGFGAECVRELRLMCKHSQFLSPLAFFRTFLNTRTPRRIF
jgi:hypothetical protein